MSWKILSFLSLIVIAVLAGAVISLLTSRHYMAERIATLEAENAQLRENTDGTAAMRQLGEMFFGAQEEALRDLDGRNLPAARNAQRRSDVNTILNAVWQYAIDNAGKLPPGIPSSPKRICAGCEDNERGNLVNLNVLLQSFLVAIPRDPNMEKGQKDSGYTIMLNDNTMRVTVAAPLAELGESIEVSR